MAGKKRQPFPKPNVSEHGLLTCSACGYHRIRMVRSPSWDPQASKRRRYECQNKICRRAWHTNEDFESVDHQSLTSPTAASRSPATQTVQVPLGLAIYVPGTEIPGRDRLTKFGIDHVAAYMQHTEKGPDSGPGWYLIRDRFQPDQAEWLRIGELWVGVIQEGTSPQPSAIPQPEGPKAKREPRESARAYGRLWRIIAKEVRDDIADQLKQGA